MLSSLLNHWWMLVLRGLVSILFALLAFSLPELTFSALVGLLGGFILLDGLTTIVLAQRTREDRGEWVLLLEGLLGIGLGIAMLLNPNMTAGLLVTLVALWCLVTGIFEISTAVRLREELDNEWMLGAAGVISIALGLLLLVRPNAGSFPISWWIGMYALLFGILLVALGFKLRMVHQQRSSARMS